MPCHDVGKTCAASLSTVSQILSLLASDAHAVLCFSGRRRHPHVLTRSSFRSNTVPGFHQGGVAEVWHPDDHRRAIRFRSSHVRISRHACPKRHGEPGRVHGQNRPLLVLHVKHLPERACYHTRTGLCSLLGFQRSRLSQFEPMLVATDFHHELEGALLRALPCDDFCSSRRGQIL